MEYEEHEEENESGGFVIKDKRRFDSEGQARQDVSEEEVFQGGGVVDLDPQEVASKVEPSRESSRSKGPSPESSSAGVQPGDGEEGVTFSAFIVSLAHQALWQMGVASPPPGITVNKDVGAARETIDILGLLRRKTEGNLDESELRLFDNILHELRLAFVKVSESNQ